MSRDVAAFDGLPDDVATLQRALLATRSGPALTEAILAETATTCEQQQAQLPKLQEELTLGNRYILGRRSERHVPDSRQTLMPLGDELDRNVVPLRPQEEEITDRRRKGHGWSKLPKKPPARDGPSFF